MNSKENQSRIIYYTSSSTSHYSRSKSTYHVCSSSVSRSHKTASLNYSQDQINVDDYYTPAEEIESDYDIRSGHKHVRSRFKTNEICNTNNNHYVNRNVYDIYAIKEQLNPAKYFDRNYSRKVSLNTENKLRNFAKEVELNIQKDRYRRPWNMNSPKINIDERKAEKTTYCRPITEFYNHEYIFKTLANKKKLQDLVKKLVTARAKEKQKAAWDNYINQLKIKHATIVDSEPSTSKARHDANTEVLLDRLNDYYNTKFRTAPSNHCKNLLKDLYSSSMDADRYPMRTYANANIFFGNKPLDNINAMNNCNTSHSTAIDGHNSQIVNVDNTNIDNTTSPFLNKFNPYLGLPSSSNGTNSPLCTFPCSSAGRMMKQRAQHSCDLGTPDWRIYVNKSRPKSNLRQYDSHRSSALNKSINELTKSPFKPKRDGGYIPKFNKVKSDPSYQEFSKEPKLKKYQVSDSSSNKKNDQENSKPLRTKTYRQPQNASMPSYNRTSYQENSNMPKTKSYRQSQQTSEPCSNRTSNHEDSKASKPYRKSHQMSDSEPYRTCDQEPKLKTYGQSRQISEPCSNRASDRESTRSHRQSQQPVDLFPHRTSDQETPKPKPKRQSQQYDSSSKREHVPKEISTQANLATSMPKEDKIDQATESEIIVDDGPLAKIENKLEELLTQMKCFMCKGEPGKDLCCKSVGCSRSQVKKPIKSCCRYTHKPHSIDLLNNKMPLSLNGENNQNLESIHVNTMNLETKNENSGPKSNASTNEENDIKTDGETTDDKSNSSYKESRASVNPAQIDEILLEEMDKSDKAKRDIEGILNGNVVKPCCRSFAYDAPTKECCTEVTHSLSKANKDDSSIESSELVEIYPNHKGKTLTIAAVNTDPLSFLALLKISSATIGRLLSFVHFDYQSLLPLPMPRPMMGYNCSICDSSFLKSTELSEHIRAHKRQPSKDCCVCRHMLDVCRTRQPKIFKCKYCNKTFTRAYCCELHQQNCAKRQGQQPDIPENLAILT